MNWKSCICACFAILSLFAAANVSAQDTLSDANRAVVTFDLQVENLVAEVKSLGFKIDEQLKQELPGLNPVTLNDVKQVEGAFSLPQDITQITGIDFKKPLPFNGFVRIRFTNAEAGSRFTEGIEDISQTVKAADGTIHFRPKSDSDIPNILIRKVSDTEFELLTDKFLNSPERNFKTVGLAKRWEAMPNKPFRIAVELTSNAKLIEQAADKMQKNYPPASGIIDALAKMKSLSLAFGLKNGANLEMVAEAKTKEDAQEFQSVFSGLLSLAKSQGKAFVSDPDLPTRFVKTANEVLDSLQAVQADKEVSFKISAPADFTFSLVTGYIAVRKATQEKIKQQNDLK